MNPKRLMDWRHPLLTGFLVFIILNALDYAGVVQHSIWVADAIGGMTS